MILLQKIMILSSPITKIIMTFRISMKTWTRLMHNWHRRSKRRRHQVHCHSRGILAAINKSLARPDGQSISSLLQNGGSVIRSIQYVVYAAPKTPSYGGTLTIQEVAPEKTFVITERLNNISDSLVSFSYTLSSNAITIKHTSCNVDVVKIGFWVVEFV